MIRPASAGTCRAAGRGAAPGSAPGPIPPRRRCRRTRHSASAAATPRRERPPAEAVARPGHEQRYPRSAISPSTETDAGTMATTARRPASGPGRTPRPHGPRGRSLDQPAPTPRKRSIPVEPDRPLVRASTHGAQAGRPPRSASSASYSRSVRGPKGLERRSACSRYAAFLRSIGSSSVFCFCSGTATP